MKANREQFGVENQCSRQRLEWKEDVGRTNDVSELGKGEDPRALEVKTCTDFGGCLEFSIRPFPYLKTWF